MKKFNKYFKFILKNKYWVIIFAVFLCEVFLRFYQMDNRNPFGFDQVVNAWAAKYIVVDHQFPLVGMPAKANSGIYIGPLYYYFLAIFYWLTNLNPIASGIAAGVTSIFTFWVLFFIAKKLFSNEVALIAIFIHTFGIQSITFDRVQVPINFLPAVSLLIFYFLYKITQGSVKSIPIVAVLIGIFFNIHFTAIFFPIMVLLVLPLFPRTIEALKYILISIPLFLVWIAPSTFAELSHKSDYGGFGRYLAENFHGFHLRRVIQITGDGLIQFNLYLLYQNLFWIKFIAIPLFFFLYLFKSLSRKKIIFCYLAVIWFIVPWFGFATYSGELTDYYFALSRFIALLIVSYFIYRVWIIKNIIPKIFTVVLLFYYAYVNINFFLPEKEGGIAKATKEVKQKIILGQSIKNQWGVPESYIYYYLTLNNNAK